MGRSMSTICASVGLALALTALAGTAGICAGTIADAAQVQYDKASGSKSGTKPGEVCVNPKDGAEMVWVPAGEFIMGTSDEQIAALYKRHSDWKGLLSEEEPQRKVYLDGYWIYKYAVTAKQYRTFCHATGRKMPRAPYREGWRDRYPMAAVSWNDARAYAEWAGVALPTEAQWEKAARGTDGRSYPWGNEWDASKCDNWVNIGEIRPKPVGSYPRGASPYGCMDMAGSVLQWCSDWYDGHYDISAPSRNPLGPAVSAIGYRVVRGGHLERGSRCASRGGYLPNGDWGSYRAGGGFRLAR
jgi:formylglycine-generating enzyme